MGTAVTTVMEAEDEEAEVIQKLEELEMQDDVSVIEVPVVVESPAEDEEAQPEVSTAKEEIQTAEAKPDDSEELRPKTAYLDRGFPDILDEKESTEGTKETLIEEKIDEAIDSVEAEKSVKTSVDKDEKESTEVKDDAEMKDLQDNKAS